MSGMEGHAYTFSGAETRALVLLLRKHEASLDPELDSFRSFLENRIYDSMTIREAEEFFNESKA